MFEIGRICIKTAGRDAKCKCVIVDVLEKNFVLVDGQTRRKKCNIKHLEPTKELIKIKKKALHTDVVKEFKKLGIEIKERKARKAAPRPRKIRKKKEKPKEETKKPVKKKPKKAPKKKEKKK